MKGLISLVTAAFALLTVLTFAFFFAANLRVQIINVAKVEYGYHNTQSALLTLLSSTYNQKSISQVIGEYLTLPGYEDIEPILREKLNSILETECYKLSLSSEDLVEPVSGCSPSKYKATAKIILPINNQEFVERLTLVVE